MDPSARHPSSTALIAAGLRLDWLHEHDAITWRMFKCLIEGPDGLFRWPDRPWLPLSYSLQATSPPLTRGACPRAPGTPA